MNKKIRQLRDCINLESAVWLWLVVPVSVLLCIIISRHTAIGYLQIYSIDEYAFHGSLRHMYESILTGKLSGLFGYGFYQYGFMYFFINLVAATPGFLFHQSAVAIFAKICEEKKGISVITHAGSAHDGGLNISVLINGFNTFWKSPFA